MPSHLSPEGPCSLPGHGSQTLRRDPRPLVCECTVSPWQSWPPGGSPQLQLATRWVPFQEGGGPPQHPLTLWRGCSSHGGLVPRPYAPRVSWCRSPGARLLGLPQVPEVGQTCVCAPLGVLGSQVTAMPRPPERGQPGSGRSRGVVRGGAQGVLTTGFPGHPGSGVTQLCSPEQVPRAGGLRGGGWGCTGPRPWC